MKNRTKLLFSAIAAYMLVGCGGGGGGGGSTPASNTAGTVADGYIYQAKVCYKGTDICAYTDADGQFILPQKNLPVVAYPETNTTNMATTKKFGSVLIAPAGITKITPLSTALYAVNNNYDELAKDLNISADVLKKYINKDTVLLADEDANASELYGKNVLLEQLTEVLMTDSNSSDIDKKLTALKAMLDYAEDYNKSLSQLTQTDMNNIFTGYKGMVVEQVSDINKTKISIIASSLASAMDANFTNVENIEKQFSSVDYSAMMNLDDTNLSYAANSLKSTVLSLVNPDMALNAVASSDLLNRTVDTPVPDINATGYIYEQNLSSDGNITVAEGRDFNISAGSEYTAVINEESAGGFLSFDDGSTVKLNQNGDITLKADVNKMKNPVERAVLTLTPKNGDVTGESQKILIIVNNPDKIISGVITEAYSSDANYADINISIKADATTHKIDDVNKTIDVNLTDPSNNYFIFAASSDNKVAKVAEYNDTNVIINPVSNGLAKVTVVSLNKQTFAPTFKTYNITVSGVDLPPVLNVSKTYYETLLTDRADVNITYSITDTDTVNNGFSVKGCDTTASNKEGNITCSFDSAGLHKVTLTASDGYLDSTPVTVYVNVFQGNVSPKLTVFAPDEVDIDTMTSLEIRYAASDLNGADTFEVNATSSDESIVKVVVDQNTSTIKLLAQPKVGAATVTVWAEDDTNLSSQKYTFTVKTKNEMASLMPTLYLVPPIDANGSLIDGRYKLADFSAYYDTGSGDVVINGDINTSDGNVTLTNFLLQPYPDDSLYAGRDTTANGLQYGFIFSNGFAYEGQFKDGRVLVYDENGKLPYYWALATKDEICKAFGDNNSTINLINSLNNNTDINCSK